MATLNDHHQHIENLLNQYHIEEARDYCRNMATPQARLWLSEINQLFPDEIQPTDDDETLSHLMADGEVSPDFLARFFSISDGKVGTNFEKSKQDAEFLENIQFIEVVFFLGIIALFVANLMSIYLSETLFPIGIAMLYGLFFAALAFSSRRLLS